MDGYNTLKDANCRSIWKKGDKDWAIHPKDVIAVTKRLSLIIVPDSAAA